MTRFGFAETIRNAEFGIAVADFRFMKGNRSCRGKSDLLLETGRSYLLQ